MAKDGLRFNWGEAGNQPPPGWVPEQYDDLRTDDGWNWEEPVAPKRRLSLYHLPALAFLFCASAALAEEGARRVQETPVFQAAQTGLAAELDALRIIKEGMACLNGEGPCPDGGRSPFVPASPAQTPPVAEAVAQEAVREAECNP